MSQAKYIEISNHLDEMFELANNLKHFCLARDLFFKLFSLEKYGVTRNEFEAEIKRRLKNPPKNVESYKQMPAYVYRLMNFAA